MNFLYEFLVPSKIEGFKAGMLIDSNDISNETIEKLDKPSNNDISPNLKPETFNSLSPAPTPIGLPEQTITPDSLIKNPKTKSLQETFRGGGGGRPGGGGRSGGGRRPGGGGRPRPGRRGRGYWGGGWGGSGGWWPYWWVAPTTYLGYDYLYDYPDYSDTNIIVNPTPSEEKPSTPFWQTPAGFALIIAFAILLGVFIAKRS